MTQLAVQNDVDVASDTKAVPASLFKAHEDRIDQLETFAGAGSVTEVTAQLPLEVTNGTDTPDITIRDASQAEKGVVTLANQVAVDNGDATKVVTADYLKATNDIVQQLDSADEISVVGDGNAISVNSVSAGGVNTYTVSAAIASDSQQGVIQIATDSEVQAGTVNDKVVTPFEVAQHYLPLNFSALNSIP